MTMVICSPTPSDDMLRDFLRAQRESVLAIVEGLSEEAWHRSVVPTGWTPAGMVEHLGGAEWHWFQGVVAGKQPGDIDLELVEHAAPLVVPGGGRAHRRVDDVGEQHRRQHAIGFSLGV